MSLFFNKEDGYFSLTTGGVIAVIIIIAVLIVLTALLREKSVENGKEQKNTFSAKQLVFCAAALALGFVTSYIKIVPMPWGGSVTLCSMLFVTLIGYWYGPKIGLIAGFAYGLLQFVQDGGSYILSPLQACLDYILAFAALGLSGLFYKKANGLLKGYLFAILVRGLLHTIGGYLYWMDYMPDNFPGSLAAIYPIVYNYAYILAEGAITIVILMLPPVKNAMAIVKKMAVED
ncbi:MAG: energy-coupled thiamine transporter ThiT [Suilimivivens sp.]